MAAKNKWCVKRKTFLLTLHVFWVFFFKAQESKIANILLFLKTKLTNLELTFPSQLAALTIGSNLHVQLTHSYSGFVIENIG